MKNTAFHLESTLFSEPANHSCIQVKGSTDCFIGRRIESVSNQGVEVYTLVVSFWWSRGACLGPPTAFLRRGTGVPWVSLPGPTSVPQSPG